MNEFPKVRSYLEASGEMVRNQPVNYLTPYERSEILCNLQRRINLIGQILAVRYSDNIFVTRDQEFFPTSALLAQLTNLLHDILSIYHTTGLASVAGLALDELSESLLHAARGGTPVQLDFDKILASKPVNRPIFDSNEEPIE